MKMPVKRTLRAAFLILLTAGLGHAPAAINDYMVFKLKDGKQVEGKVVQEDDAKVVVEVVSRGIAKQENVYRHTVADFHVLTAAELEQRAKAAAQPAATSAASGPVFPTVTQAVPAAQATATPAQAVQQGQQLLTQGRVWEAIQLLERSVGQASDPNMPSEPRQLLRQAYAAWVKSLQDSRQQLALHVDQAKQQLDQAQRTLEADNRMLDGLRKQLSDPARFMGYDNRGMRKYDNSAQNEARGRMTAAELTVMTDTAEMNKRLAVHGRLAQQLATLDQQIVAAQTRLSEQDAAINQREAQLRAAEQQRFAQQMAQQSQVQQRLAEQVAQQMKIVQASFGMDDVTAVVQSMVKDNSLTLCVKPQLFGLSHERAGDGKFRVTYSIGSEKKTLTILPGWTVTLPVLKLTPPETSAPATASASSLEIRRAMFNGKDVTAFVQRMVKGNSLKVRAVPELFGLSKDILEEGQLVLDYALGAETKSVTVESGWAIELPSLTLTEPERAWYVKNWPWLFGGVFVLWFLSRALRGAS